MVIGFQNHGANSKPQSDWISKSHSEPTRYVPAGVGSNLVIECSRGHVTMMVHDLLTPTPSPEQSPQGHNNEGASWTA